MSAESRETTTEEKTWDIYKSALGQVCYYRIPPWYFSDLARIFGVYFCQIAEFPGLLSFVKITFVGFLHLHHFHLHGSLGGDWNKKASYFRSTLLKISSVVTYSYSGGYYTLTCRTQEAVLFFLPRFADINNTEETLIIGCEDVPLESVLYGCHGGMLLYRTYTDNILSTVGITYG